MPGGTRRLPWTEVKLYSSHSDISGEVEVWEQGVERKLKIGGATQSILRTDGIERGYWLGQVPGTSVKSALILGLGGGTVARILRKKWPWVKIVAYEIDPTVVRVAKEFFNLDPATEVRIASAEEAFKTKEKFDLVTVDVYKGYEYFPLAESEDFIKSIHDKLNPGGLASFNRVKAFGMGNLGPFEAKLKLFFPEVWKAKASLNLVYWGKK